MGVSGALTIAPGRLTVGTAFPDPPFDVSGEPYTGLDVELMQAVASSVWAA